MKLKLATCLLAFSNMAFSNITFAAVSTDLTSSVNNWQNVMNNKDLNALSSYYDDSSLVAQFPYKPENNLIGLSAIKNMFANGPFNLNQLNATINTIALAEQKDLGLLLKSWDIKFDKGNFSGLALEVMTHKQGKWIRTLDLGAGGINSAFGFSTQDLEPTNNAFDSAINTLKQAKRTDINPNAKQLDLNDKSLQFDNLLAIENQDTGLLISKIIAGDKNYISLSAVKKHNSKWMIESSLIASEH